MWMLAALSTALGVIIAVLMNLPGLGSVFFFLGIAHGAVFIPTMIIDGCSIWKTVVAGVLCTTFPVWGISGGILLFSITTPFADSFVWGFVVAWALGRPRMILVFFVVGVLSNLSLFMIMDFQLGSSSDWGISQTIGVWYVILLPVFPMILRLHPKPDAVPNPDECMYCGYSLVGLPKDLPCPECGRENDDVVEKFSDV